MWRPVCVLGHQAGYDFTGALQGVCDITFEEGPLAILASELAAADMNTSDFTLDDPLSAGRRNARVLGTQVYDFLVAKQMLVRLVLCLYCAAAVCSLQALCIAQTISYA
jgi:hypothetical protein